MIKGLGFGAWGADSNRGDTEDDGADGSDDGAGGGDGRDCGNDTFDGNDDGNDRDQEDVGDDGSDKDDELLARQQRLGTPNPAMLHPKLPLSSLATSLNQTH